MFNVICTTAFFALLPSLFFNYFLNYPLYVLLIILGLLIELSYLYYLSRFKHRFNISRIIFAVNSYAFLILNYFYNSGINGPTLIAFFLTYVFLLAIFSRKTYPIWTALHIVTGSALLMVSFFKPESAPYSYIAEGARVTDFIVTYVTMLLFSFFALDFIRANYDYEKKSATDKAHAIEAHNKELEKVNSEKNKLFSIVSHDLRSPLNTIQSYMELLSSDLLDAQEKAVAEKELLTLTKNTSDLLFNLLSWSKTQMEGVHAKLREQNLFNILAGTINTQHAIASQKDISFTNNISKTASAICDEDMVQLVVRNLLNNAIKFTPTFGKITVDTIQTDKEVIISISDSGKGIPLEQQKEIFSLKIRSTYGTNNEKGIGLGLVLCKDYIELQNGSIWFESVPNEQTVFHISLPRAQA